MTVTILQPAYWPWLGYIERIARSDHVIFLDSVRIDRNSKTKFANRNKIRTKEGWIWLTIPFIQKGPEKDRPICELRINQGESWCNKHLGSLQHNYAHAAQIAEHRAFLNDIYGKNWERLADVSNATVMYLLRAFGVSTPVSFSSQLSVEGEGSELILNLCRAVGAKTYISGPFGREYLNGEGFAQAGIKVQYHVYQHPTYPQVFPGFEPHMSALDLLLTHGGEAGRRILLTEAPLES